MGCFFCKSHYNNALLIIKRRQVLKIMYKWLAFVLFVAIYVSVIPMLGETVDACSNTPGYNYTYSLLVLAIFPFISAFILYRFFYYKKKFNKIAYIKTLIAFLGVILLSFMLLGFEVMIMLDAAQGYLNHTASFSWFFEYGCYHDIEIRYYVISAFYIFNISLFSYLFYLVRKKIFSKY